jgi:hypothetical protein
MRAVIYLIAAEDNATKSVLGIHRRSLPSSLHQGAQPSRCRLSRTVPQPLCILTKEGLAIYWSLEVIKI